jgi:hypothetical protein
MYFHDERVHVEIHQHPQEILEDQQETGDGQGKTKQTQTCATTIHMNILSS